MATTKGFRLDEELRKNFERFCRDHLLDERAVVEAWILRFLESPTEERQAVAKRYADWLGEQKPALKINTPSRAPRKKPASGGVPKER